MTDADALLRRDAVAGELRAALSADDVDEDLVARLTREYEVLSDLLSR